MGVLQSPGLTHPSQRFGTPVPICCPSAFRPSDFESLGLLPRGWGPRLSTVGSAWEGP